MTRTALETCDLYRMRNWPVDAVSYGQKKRITIASALAAGPDVLIMDEPTAGQDYRHYTEILSFINRLNREYGKTVIFITHDIHLAIESTDRAVVFGDEGKGGAILADGDIFAILSDSRIVEAANLKPTSLHVLAEKTGMEAEPCIRRYINYERELKEQP
jgi:energy-coupling factor transport system ATP-binding protein